MKRRIVFSQQFVIKEKRNAADIHIQFHFILCLLFSFAFTIGDQKVRACRMGVMSVLYFVGSETRIMRDFDSYNIRIFLLYPPLIGLLC